MLKFVQNAYGEKIYISRENMKKYRFLTVLIVGFCSLLLFQAFCKDPVNFYSPEKGVYFVEINPYDSNIEIVPYFSPQLETVKTVAVRENAIVAINAGFFDPKNMMTTSYVVKDSQLVGDPRLNNALMTNETIQHLLPDFLNRSEFRILKDANNNLKFQIARHNEPLKGGCTLLHSIQAGPELIPSLKLDEEMFVVRKDGKVVRQSAEALGKHARSAIGIKGKDIVFVAVSNEKKITIEELAQLLKKYGFTQALAFDGGSSTSLYVNLPSGKYFNLVSAKDDQARKVKSMFLVKIKQ